jgi:hypothetical protein
VPNPSTIAGEEPPSTDLDQWALSVAREVWERRAVGADEGHIISRIQVALMDARRLGWADVIAILKEEVAIALQQVRERLG